LEKPTIFTDWKEKEKHPQKPIIGKFGFNGNREQVSDLGRATNLDPEP
jgi:hypothetical protein